MRSKGPQQCGVLTPNELEQILRECRSGDYTNAEWLYRYFQQDWVEDPTENGISWEDLDRWRRAAPSPPADDAD